MRVKGKKIPASIMVAISLGIPSFEIYFNHLDNKYTNFHLDRAIL